MLELLEGTDEVNDGAPDLEVITGFYLEDGIVGVGRSEFDVAIRLVGKVEILHGKLAVPEGYDDRAVVRLYSLVDDDTVAIKDASVLHRVALYITIE
jgi:hypothetical protein